MSFVIYLDTKKQYRWQLRSRNGKVIADSAEAYVQKRDCLKIVWKIIEKAAFTKLKDQTV